MLEMGFDKQTCVQALGRANGNVGAAMEILLGSG
jgi:hypothetical protein